MAAIGSSIMVGSWYSLILSENGSIEQTRSLGDGVLKLVSDAECFATLLGSL